MDNKTRFIQVAVAIYFTYLGLVDIFFYKNLLQNGLISLTVAIAAINVLLYDKNIYSKRIKNIVLAVCVSGIAVITLSNLLRYHN